MHNARGSAPARGSRGDDQELPVPVPRTWLEQSLGQERCVRLPISSPVLRREELASGARSVPSTLLVLNKWICPVSPCLAAPCSSPLTAEHQQTQPWVRAWGLVLCGAEQIPLSAYPCLGQMGQPRLQENPVGVKTPRTHVASATAWLSSPGQLPLPAGCPSRCSPGSGGLTGAGGARRPGLDTPSPDLLRRQQP